MIAPKMPFCWKKLKDLSKGPDLQVTMQVETHTVGEESTYLIKN